MDVVFMECDTFKRFFNCCHFSLGQFGFVKHNHCCINCNHPYIVFNNHKKLNVSSLPISVINSFVKLPKQTLYRGLSKLYISLAIISRCNSLTLDGLSVVYLLFNIMSIRLKYKISVNNSVTFDISLVHNVGVGCVPIFFAPWVVVPTYIYIALLAFLLWLKRKKVITL